MALTLYICSSAQAARRPMARRSANVLRPDREALKAFLAAGSRPAGTLQYHQLQGFLFSVTSSPEVLLPSDWLPLVFADHEPGYRHIAEARSIVGALISAYNDINAGVAAGTPTLPADCAFRDDALKNLEPDAPVSQWSQGFTLGHDWLRETWQRYVPEDDDSFGTIVLALSFFSARRLAEAYRKELRLPQSLAAIATTIRDVFPEALRDYARLGRMISGIVAEHETPTTPRTKTPGKNRRAGRR